MLLSEQERNLGSEQKLISNSNQYGTTSSSWTTINDYGNITTPAAGIVFFNFTASANTYATFGIVALYIGGIPVEVVTNSYGGSGTAGGAAWLLQGTYDVQAQGMVSGSSSAVYIQNLQVGYTLLNDCVSYPLQSVTQGTGGTINLTVPNRNTPVGPLNQAVFAINVSVQAPSNQIVGGISVVVDGGTQSLDETGPTAYATSAKCFVPLSVGTQHSIYATTGNSSATMYISIIACPWILTTAARLHQPVTLSFPQQSTLYAIIDPLFNDTFKECFVGKPKGVSFGAASDYYGYASAATGSNVSFSFTFDSVNTLYVIMSADGLGCCIDNITADIV
jgi:hypothetical protein